MKEAIILIIPTLILLSASILVLVEIKVNFAFLQLYTLLHYILVVYLILPLFWKNYLKIQFLSLLNT